MKQLTGVEAAFLRLETAEAPMHVGGIHVCDAATATAPFDYAQFREFVSSRLHLWDRFRKSVVEVPLSLSYPYWVDDAHFHIDHHLQRLALPRPGGVRELCDLAAQIFTRPLDRRRALWDMTFVDGLDGFEGLDPGSFAIVSRFHQTIAAGVAGTQALVSMTDADVDPPDKPWRPGPVPTDSQLLAHAYGQALSRPVELAKLIGKGAMTAAQIVGDGLGRSVPRPPQLFKAPRAPWNAPVSADRQVVVADFELDRFLALRREPETCVNDVLLAVVAGALRMYLEMKDALPERPLIAMCPVMTHGEKDGTSETLPMVVNLGTDQDDALGRLGSISEQMRTSRVYERGLRYREMVQHIPFSLTTAAVGLYTRMHLADRHRPIFNLVCAHVPGPDWDRSIGGARVVGQAGLMPLFDGLGLMVCGNSVAGRMTISVVTCPRLVPDADRLADFLELSLQAMESAAARKKARPRKKRPKT